MTSSSASVRKRGIRESYRKSCAGRRPSRSSAEMRRARLKEPSVSTDNTAPPVGNSLLATGLSSG